MFELLKKRIKNEKGLSLVELLAVIVILGIVAAIAIPAIGNIIENSRYNAVKSDAINVLNAANLYFTDNSDKNTVTIAELKTATFLESEGKITSGTVTKGDATKATSLVAGPIIYSGTKNVSFAGATIKGINDNPDKGSGNGGYTISN